MGEESGAGLLRVFLRPSVVLLVVGVVGVLGLSAAGASVGGGEDLPSTPLVSDRQMVTSELAGVDLNTLSSPEKGNRKLQTALFKLTQAEDAFGLPGAAGMAESMSIPLDGASVRVVAQVLPGKGDAVMEASAGMGISVEGQYEDLVQLLVPVTQLESLASIEEIAFVRLPWEIELLGSITGEGVSVIGADAWHAAGFTGAGVKVGVLDLGFAGYEALLGSELPDSVVVNSCRADGDITGSGESHGTGVAEIVHETAPDATLYFANIQTVVEMASCVDWLKAQGVDIINFSAGYSYLGPGDGTGLINEIVDTAKSDGILWVNAAGNAAQRHWDGCLERRGHRRMARICGRR